MILMIGIKKLVKHFMVLYVALLNINLAAAANQEVIYLGKIQPIAVALHLTELVLAIFICYMALRFFRITKPVNLFLVIYVAIGFFVINSLLYLLFYAARLKNMDISFASVYLGSRVALIAMLISLGSLFYYLNRQMRKF